MSSPVVLLTVLLASAGWAQQNCPTDPCTPERNASLDFQKTITVECNNCSGQQNCTTERCDSFSYQPREVRCCRDDLNPVQCLSDSGTATEERCAVVEAAPGTWLYYDWNFNIEVSVCSLTQCNACDTGAQKSCYEGVREEVPVLLSDDGGSIPCP